MTKTLEDVKAQVRGSGFLSDRINACKNMIGKMCSEGRPPRMSVPVEFWNEDIFIVTTMEDAQAELAAAKAELDQARAEVERLGKMVPVCNECDGTGEQAGYIESGGAMRCVPESCDNCGGTGKISNS